MRFSKNEHVFHESGGVCKISDIQTAPLEGMPKDRVYYIMQPVHDPNSVIYVPVDSDSIFVRGLLSRNEAEDLLAKIEQIESIDEPNAKVLRAKYIDAMRTHLPKEWICVIKTVTARMRMLALRSQRVSETERSYYETAKRHLCTELSLVLGIGTREVEDLIAEKTPI